MLALVAGVAIAPAQVHPAAPALNSNPGATYTLYLNFGGFDYRSVVNNNGAGYANGTWGYTQKSPGIVPSYDTDGDLTSFSTAEVDQIKKTWAQYANAYRGFNINVTTVDPAAAVVGDAAKHAFYDQAQHVQQTIIGGSYTWFGSAGGVSYVGTTQSANTFTGGHTNWVFPANGTGTDSRNMAVAGIHEDGHALGLNHQHDETNGNEYTRGDYTGSNYRAAGTYGAIMGDSYYVQRDAWRIGSAAKGNANDVAALQANRDMGPLQDDGIGHALLTATALAISPTGLVDVHSSKTEGFIMPLASTGYSADAYTEDFFSFATAGGLVTLVAHDGTTFLEDGVADPGATMRSALTVYDFGGNVVGTGLEDSTTMLHTFSRSLGAGQYYARISSYGAYVSSHEPNARYFNMGGYFLTGSGFAQAVPEPASLVALVAGSVAFLRRRRKAA